MQYKVVLRLYFIYVFVKGVSVHSMQCRQRRYHIKRLGEQKSEGEIVDIIELSIIYTIKWDFSLLNRN